MRVLKFGGTSVGNVDRIRSSAEIVAAAAQEGPLLVAVSAVGGVTDALLRGAEQAAAGGSVIPALARFHSVHRQVLDGLRGEIGDARAAEIEGELGALEREMENLLRGFGLLRECPPSALAVLSSLGERASSALFARLLIARGLDARLYDAKTLIRTTGGTPLSAAPDWKATRQAFAPLRENPPAVAVLPGFFGGDAGGRVNLLGRGGSDYSAAIAAWALDAELLEIWTDVDGIYTADPRLVPHAAVLPEVSYEEAMELSFFGAKVLHPKTIQPAREKGIPVRVRNSFAPESSGSLVHRGAVATSTFSDRPDVLASLNETSPAGWRIPLDTTGLAPGEHRLALWAWASEKGEARYLAERQLTVREAGESLDDSFRTAAARVREHQQAAGYWLTAHTTVTRFEEPRPEMNTFLTALLIDLLDPVAAAGGLGDSLRRARQHLTAQIEAGGLVRYHGLPDGPGIGTLGCAITPDTDDTALVWRIAPDKDRRRLPAALATLDQYRTGEGLYRTWLAPREAYQCLDPGSDPNPADITIQMHLLLLLAEAQPPAGRALCEALRPVVDQDRVWVYYRKAPLVPTLRLPDLRRAGCDLKLPESRMRTPVPEQEIWMSVVRLLGSADTAQAKTVLRQLAKDDFALLRQNPPLLYHNDLTATVSRYYWSEDVGYALWLRLYQEHEHLVHPRLDG